MNKSGVVVGTDFLINGTDGFLYSNGSYTAIRYPTTKANITFVTGINDNGTVIGFYGDPNFLSPVHQHGFLYSNGAYSTLDAPVGDLITLTGINTSGSVLGYSTGSGPGFYNFVYSSGTFTQVVDPDAVPGSTLALGINDAGALTGVYSDANGVGHGFIATPSVVPEPSSMALCGVAALVALISARARRAFVSA